MSPKDHKSTGDTELSQENAQKKVLIAEDEPSIRKLIETLAIEAGIPKANICSAQDGQQALDFLKADHEKKIQLAILDLRMPIVDGFEVVKQLRKPDRILKLLSLRLLNLT